MTIQLKLNKHWLKDGLQSWFLCLCNVLSDAVEETEKYLSQDLVPFLSCFKDVHVGRQIRNDSRRK